MTQTNKGIRKEYLKKKPGLANIERFCDFKNAFHTKPPKLKP
jgi:hypothetical protein